MPWATVWSPALDHLRAATSRFCSRTTLGQLLCDIVNDHHSKKTSLTPHTYLKSRKSKSTQGQIYLEYSSLLVFNCLFISLLKDYKIIQCRVALVLNKRYTMYMKLYICENTGIENWRSVLYRSYQCCKSALFNLINFNV